MKKRYLVPIAAVTFFVTTASAATKGADGSPRMEFHTIPAEGAPTLEHKVTPYRLPDRVVVTVWEPSYCGQKPTNPGFSIKGDKLLLSYVLSPVPPETKRCTLISEFDVFNAPQRDLEVNFTGGTEPYTIATLKNCSNLTQGSDELWQCLTPVKK